jgi:hypothetical protein
MLTGDPAVRTMNQNSAEAKKLSYRCFTDARRSGETSGAEPGGGISSGQDTYAMPDKVCPGGFRSQVYFPTLVYSALYIFATTDLPFIAAGTAKTPTAPTTRATSPTPSTDGAPRLIPSVFLRSSMRPSGTPESSTACGPLA